jgi:hypothetical protein
LANVKVVNIDPDYIDRDDERSGHAARHVVLATFPLLPWERTLASFAPVVLPM